MRKNKLQSPELDFHIGERGVERVTVTTALGRRADGIQLLGRLLPVLSQLDSLSRGGAQ